MSDVLTVDAGLSSGRNPMGGFGKAASPVAPVGAKSAEFSTEQAAALVAAGRLIQSKAWPGGRRRVARAEGEAYTEAVARAIADDMPAAERDHLRELVSWVRSYERAEAGG